ncbi:hypothetical protein [Terrarubrum flagellatum]|uniref:hypothetical protein n=1 Tax=Terrirubrum flagellatum TaxID=2895980 RepID=UPI0031451877
MTNDAPDLASAARAPSAAAIAKLTGSWRLAAAFTVRMDLLRQRLASDPRASVSHFVLALASRQVAFGSRA